MLPDQPIGWTLLQQRAKQARTPEELAAIIDEMNRLLRVEEDAAARLEGWGPETTRRRVA